MLSFKLKEEEYELDEIEVKYLFPYLFRFDNNTGMTLLEDGVTKLTGDNLIEFKGYLSGALSELLLDCYEEPPVKRRQKHSTFFEKFMFDGKKYIVDYTTSAIGRLMYTLFLRIVFVDKAIQLEDDLIVTKLN